jgi:cbb3-type cytochrome oxidase cytochrome c subunit
MNAKTGLGIVIVVLGVVAIAAVAVLEPVATCTRTGEAIGGLSPVQFVEVADGEVVYSRNGGASICSIPPTVLAVPGGFVVAGVGLFVLGS